MNSENDNNSALPNKGNEGQNVLDQKAKMDGSMGHRRERRLSNPNPRLSNPPNNIHGEQVAAGWPSWFSAVAGEAINGWIPRQADAFEKHHEACISNKIQVLRAPEFAS